jgi:hypothetical protein
LIHAPISGHWAELEGEMEACLDLRCRGRTAAKRNGTENGPDRHGARDAAAACQSISSPAGHPASSQPRTA